MSEAALYRTMLTIRRFEERVVDLVNANEIAGVTHEYVGQEAVATGVCAALRDDDVITSTHRGHGHLIAKGADVGRMMAELLGRVDGLNRGRGGSMHVADLALGIYGANGIVAAGAPFGITPYGTESMHVLRAEKGYPIIGQDTDGTVIESLYPATGEVIARLHAATPAIVEQAIAAAKRAQPEWAAMSPTASRTSAATAGTSTVQVSARRTWPSSTGWGRPGRGGFMNAMAFESTKSTIDVQTFSRSPKMWLTVSMRMYSIQPRPAVYAITYSANARP